jgi:uncharacterized membrane-anchored protein
VRIVLIAFKAGVVLYLAAVLAAGASAYLVLEYAFREPYGTVQPGDMYKQVAGTTVLMVLWVQLSVLAVCLAHKRCVSRIGAAIVLGGSVVATIYLWSAQKGYIVDLCSNAETLQCFP